MLTYHSPKARRPYRLLAGSKSADFVEIYLAATSNQLIYDPISQIVYAATVLHDRRLEKHLTQARGFVLGVKDRMRLESDDARRRRL